MINQQQHKKKKLYKYWFPYKLKLKNAIFDEYKRTQVKIRPSFNKFIFIPSYYIWSLTDLITGTNSRRFHENDIGYNIHHMCFSTIINKHIKSQVEWCYYPYTHKIDKMIIYQFFDDENQDVIPHTNLYIRPIGYYRFNTSSRIDTNIDTIYFDTGGVKHTNKDLVVYEISDYHYLDIDEKIKSEAPKTIELNNVNDLFHTTKDKVPGDMDKNLVQKIFYESDEDTKSPKDIRDIPIKYGRHVEFYQHKKIGDMIKIAIQNKSKFYHLVKEVDVIFVRNSIHNSFHKTEKYDHFSIIVNEIAYHIYIDETDKIIYHTRIVQEYE